MTKTVRKRASSLQMSLYREPWTMQTLSLRTAVTHVSISCSNKLVVGCSELTLADASSWVVCIWGTILRRTTWRERPHGKWVCIVSPSPAKVTRGNSNENFNCCQGNLQLIGSYLYRREKVALCNVGGGWRRQEVTMILPFHLNRILVKPPAVEEATSRW